MRAGNGWKGNNKKPYRRSAAQNAGWCCCSPFPPETLHGHSARRSSHTVGGWCLTLQFSFRGGLSWRSNPPALRALRRGSGQASPFAKGGLRGIFRCMACPRREPLGRRQASIFKLRHYQRVTSDRTATEKRPGTPSPDGSVAACRDRRFFGAGSQGHTPLWPGPACAARA